MKNFKNWASKIAAILPALAFVVGVTSLNSACLLVYHQPEISPSLDEYRK